jgi:acetyl-CoA carboxylase biotin carboxyl carrier protein
MRTEPKDILALIELFDTSDWEEMHLETNGVQLFLSRDPAARLTTGAPPVAAPLAPPAAAPAPAMAPPVAASPAATAAPATAQSSEVPAHWLAVTAPCLGTFYRAPKPGDAPFVELGQAVVPGNDLCLLEVMKLFTRVPATAAGIVRRICKQDSDMVEFGDVLFYVEPA